MELEIVTLAERPDLMDVFWDLKTSWPEFMKHDPIGNGYYASLEEFSEFVLVCLRDNAGRLGFSELLAPVRPNGKADVQEPMTEYAARTRDDGLPVDPWLRVHVRAGGRIDRVAPRSMVIPGTVEEWRGWTGLPFDTTGPVVVPGALAPVMCDAEHGTATYVEPNVWVRHPTGAWALCPP